MYDNHAHCMNCFKLDCHYELCKLIECHQVGCKFQMHQCKYEDHLEICLKKRVSCINSENGCNLILMRNELISHLERCPASVISCSFEHNRWPAHSVKRQFDRTDRSINYRKIDENSLNSNLNIAFAFHDQQMLNELYKYKKMRNLFKSYYTKKYPALPISAYLCSSKRLHSKEEQSNELSSDLAKCSSFASNTSCQSHTTSTITNSEDESDEIWNIHRSPPGLQSSVSEKLRDCSNNKSNAIKKLNQSNQMIEETLTSTSESSSDEENQSFVFGQSECKVKKSKRKKVYKYPGKLNHLILDLNIEFIASHAVKPKKIYTFSCGHDFRRDEYCSHYQNVHSDIMGSLNFMEKQCPLTQYGCSFFIRRIHPVHNGLTTKIIFNRQAFNHLIEPEICNDNNSISLIDMPIELITKILGYLDAISLNNLSLTNKLMRSLCCRQLERSGIVSLIWKKEINQTNWKIIGYQWCFSQHFSLISKWKFENDDKMLNHLTKCKHYDRIYRTEPYKLIGLCSLKR